MKRRLEKFLYGENFASAFARSCLPVLVSRAEQYRGKSEDEIPDFTYGDLAAIVADRNYAHAIHSALGTIGHALQELNQMPEWKSKTIPPIQLMVWSKGRGRPGDLAFSFIGKSKKDAAHMEGGSA